MLKKIMIIVAVMMFGMVSAASAADINLTNWTQEGLPENGIWTVSEGGNYVIQSATNDSNPTYFVSDTNYINTEIKGTFEVIDSIDDDYIGLVFGYNGLDDFLLFDWKRGTDWDVYQGFRLSKITDNSNVDYWNHTGTGIEVLDSLLNWSGWGWENNTEHAFTLTYDSDNIQIDIDGTTIFDIAGTFSDGKFGFYDYSQRDVKYGVSAVPVPPTILLLGSGFIGMITVGRRKFFNN